MQKAAARAVILVLIACIMIFSLTANQSLQVRATSSSSVSATGDVNAYSNSACTNQLTNLNWGAVALNAPVTQDFWLKNSGSSAYYIANVTLSDFVFKDSNGNIINTDYSSDFKITINSTDAVLCPNGSSYNIIGVQVALTISNAISSQVHSFTCSVNIQTNQMVSPADVNLDGQVNFNDVNFFIGNYIACNNGQPWQLSCDLDHCGVLNFNDIVAFEGYYIQYYNG